MTDSELVVAFLNGKPIGTIKMSKSATLGYRDRDEYREIGQLALLPEYRGKGYGSQLMKFAIENVESRGLKVVLELVHPQSGDHKEKNFLKIWYGQLGFKEVKNYKINRLEMPLFDFGNGDSGKDVKCPLNFTIFEKIK